MYTEVLQEKSQESGQIDFVKEKIISSIKHHGSNAEHNYHYFMNSEEEGTKNTLIDFGEGRVILSNIEIEDNAWNVFPSGIIAEEKEKNNLFRKFCEYCIEQRHAKEVYAELSFELYCEIKDKMEDYHVSDVQFEYTWPIVDLENFDEKLDGSEYYELRKIRNNFLKNNEFQIINGNEVPIEKLKKILQEWESNRKSKDSAHSTEYKSWINTNFEGADYAKCWAVNREPCAIVAGWKIPNSNSFYLEIVLHNYAIKNLGEMIYLQTILELKKVGYSSCNLGGSDKKLLNFKNKFLPTEFYKTVEFFVRKK